MLKKKNFDIYPSIFTRCSEIYFTLFTIYLSNKSYLMWTLIDFDDNLVEKVIPINVVTTDSILSYNCGFIIFDFHIKYRESNLTNRERRFTEILNILECQEFIMHTNAKNKLNDEKFIIQRDDKFYRLTKYEVFYGESITCRPSVEFEEIKDINIHKELVAIESDNLMSINEIILCYDCETITCELNDGAQTPYMLVVKKFLDDVIDYGESSTIIFENKNVFSNPNKIAQDFSKYINEMTIKLSNCYHLNKDVLHILPCIRIFGFNNYKFDDHMIFSEMRKLDTSYSIVRARNNKTTSTIININNISVIFNDLISWLPDKSLYEACVDYGITNPKMPVNIVEYNKLCIEKKEMIETLPFIISVEENGKSKKIANPTINKLYSSDANTSQKNEIRKKYVSNNIFSIYELIKEYCLVDVMSTFELYTNVYESTKNVIKITREKTKYSIGSENCFNYISPSQLAGLILKSTINKAFTEMKWLTLKNNLLAHFIFSSYFGGRVDFGIIGEYAAAKENNLAYYDVTSEYTLCMNAYYPLIESEDDFQIGIDIDLKKIQQDIDECLSKRNEFVEKKEWIKFEIFSKFDIEYKAILICDIDPPIDKNNLIAFGPIATRTRENLVYYNGQQKSRILNTSHFKNLILSGFHIKVQRNPYNILFKKTAQIFKPFVDFIGAEKSNAREDNKSFAKLLKLILNSAAGKLAQKPLDETIEYTSAKKIFNVEYKNNHEKKENWEKSKHYLATFITAEANHVIFKYAYQMCYHYVVDKISYEKRGPTILYTDTDSIVIDKTFLDSRFKPFLSFSEEIGTWRDHTLQATWKEKYEQKINKIVVIAKKSYILFDKNNNAISTKLKGIHSEFMKKFEKIETLRDIISGNKKSISIETLSKASIEIDKEFLNIRSNKSTDTIKLIKETLVKKTLACVDYNNFKIINCENELVLSANESNINYLHVIMPKDEAIDTFSKKYSCDNFLKIIHNESKLDNNDEEESCEF